MDFSADDIANHSDNLNAIGDAAVDDLRAYCDDLFSGVDWSDADDDMRKQLRNQVIDHVNYIQETYGSASESIGSLFFDNALSNDGELANAVMEGTANNQQVSNSVRYWARHLFGENPDLDAFVGGVSAFVRRTVTHAADLSVAESAVSTNEQQDLGIRYARVPQGPTCSFCIMLASRGFVYASRESAGELGQYHDDCNCRIVAGMPGTEVEGYDPEGMYDRYLQCRDSITHGESGSRNPVWRDWERLSPEEQASYAEPTGGDAYNNYLDHRIVQEMSTRDRRWLYDGTVPKITYESEELKTKIEKEHPHEIRTANRLREHGIRTDFVVDEALIVDPTTGRDRKIGLADFENGYEIKTLLEASSFNTIDGYIKNASKKKNIVALVFDNSENDLLTDEQLGQYILRSRRFKSGRIYIIGKGKSFIRIR